LIGIVVPILYNIFILPRRNRNSLTEFVVNGLNAQIAGLLSRQIEHLRCHHTIGRPIIVTALG
jgi:hypothetical protein